jgi:hypothetical protein
MDIEILCDLICVFFVGYDGTTGDWGDDYSRYMSADGVDLTAVSIIFLMIVVFFLNHPCGIMYLNFTHFLNIFSVYLHYFFCCIFRESMGIMGRL